MVAEGRGVRVGVVMRMAVEIGLSALANGEEGAGVVPCVADPVNVATAVVPSGVAFTVPGAGSASSRARAGADDPRPSAPASPAPSLSPALGLAAVRLEAVVARLFGASGAGGVVAGSDVAIDVLRREAHRAIPPADLAQARRKVLRGEVTVAGGVCRNPVQLVDPVEVGLS